MKQKQLITAISKWVGIGVLNIHMAQAGGLITVDTVSDQQQQGFTTLREAIALANTSSNIVIEFDETLFSEPQTIVLEQGELTLSSSTTIEGPGSNLLTIDGDNNSRVFRLSDDDNNTTQAIEISGVTITNGNGISPAENRKGGCILSFEGLSLNDSVVTGCKSEGRGGGIHSRYGSLTVDNTTISQNRGGNEGGGVYTRQVTVSITNSTISDNEDSDGAGIFIERASNVEIINTTVSNNSSFVNSSFGIFARDLSTTVNLINSTVVNNDGSGIAVINNATFNIINSIIAGNGLSDCDLAVLNLNSFIRNSLDTDGSCDVSATNHITVADAKLEPLNFYGGPTKTHRPQVDSAAVDAGDDLFCVAFDQRGQVRPQDGNGDDNAVCDIGAVELAEFEDVVFINGFDR
ncbi:MAG: right-handed parallel beta-helix repeat-containing protein [Xanthomonadales bacterium]|nr:right-handed parallel beta-helix repeat-containing protein [Xanthomonadales bacterium]